MIRVATGGCFDILHAGHIDYFKRICKFVENQYGLSSYNLEVYVNSDSSVRLLKGKDRPINDLQNRIIMLEAIRYIDSVHVFEEDTPCNIIKYRQPDIWVKGGDYTMDDLPEAEVVKSYGGKVYVLPFRIDISTTKIIEKIKNG